MPRARDPRRAEAREMWEASGKKLSSREIAKKLSLPEKTVSGWKTKDNWAQKVPKRKRGGQPGNKNAKGGPPGNMYSVTTGAYMRIYEELLTDEEKALMDEIMDQTLQRKASLLQLLATLKIRERRILKDLNDIRAGEEQLVRKTLTLVEPAGRDAGGQEVHKVVRISQEQEDRRALQLRFEDSLTRIQAEIRRAEDSLRQLDEKNNKEALEKEKFEHTKDIDNKRHW